MARAWRRLDEGGALDEGLGVLLWTDNTGVLGIGDLNASTVSLAEGGTGWGNIGAGSRRGGSIQAKKSLALSTSETLLQACYQASNPSTPVLIGRLCSAGLPADSGLRSG